MERCKTVWRVALFFAFLVGVVIPEVRAQTAPPAPKELLQELPSEDRALLESKVDEAIRVGVPKSDAASIVQRGLNRGLSPSAIAELMDLASEGGREHLPLRPLLNKINEGLAKGVPPPRIESVGQNILDDLKASKEIVRHAEKLGFRPVRKGDQDRTIEALAEAKWRGVPLEALRDLPTEFRKGRSGKDASLSRVESAAETLVTLMDSGLSAPSATETVRIGLSRGLSREEFRRLERAIRHGRKGRGSAEDAAKRVRESLATGRDIHEIERELRERRDREDRERPREEQREQDDRKRSREERRGRDRGDERSDGKRTDRHDRRGHDRAEKPERQEKDRHERQGRHERHERGDRRDRDRRDRHESRDRPERHDRHDRSGRGGRD
ncbi:MAG: hypothetical protein ACE5G5_00020 [Candidatus Methylomirabilales bacterium]